ncbi:terminase [Streptomyces sp. WAC02707]|uniref:phage terminase large subunit n=1 Tax=Streptomyces sp. WAC02707 TaxID=2487417 RepID=UPI000F7B3F41|nr:phage terminase large subunit [Streptomyces sp. WAC02707]RSS92459.1 terminase [Streptomyces sp. WAC02707]
MTATVVRYEPRGGAKTLLTAKDQEICIAGPAGTGKSLAMLQKAFYTSLMVPNCRSLIVRQTHASLTGSTLVTFEQQVATAALAEGVVKWFGGSPRKPAAYQFANGSEILVGGLDRPEKFLSTEFSRIYIDEATQISLKALETLITRLRGNADTYRQIILACNPDHPKHWIKQRCDDGTMRMLNSLHRDNPLYVQADGTLTERGVDYMAKLDALTGVRRLRYRDGIWAAAEGLVYEGWQDAVHVIDPFDVPDSWVRWVTVDFGFTNPFVAQLWAEDPDGRLYLVREWVRTRMLVEDHATVIRDRLLAGHPRPRAIITDHDAEDRATLERKLGMGTQAAHKTVSDGIQAFGARLRPQGDGRPRLFVFRDALLERDPEMDAAALPIGLAEEALGYVWAVKPGNAGGLKEEPVKENDHSMDAGRYMVAARDLGGRPRVRWL